MMHPGRSGQPEHLRVVPYAGGGGVGGEDEGDEACIETSFKP